MVSNNLKPHSLNNAVLNKIIKKIEAQEDDISELNKDTHSVIGKKF